MATDSALTMMRHDLGPGRDGCAPAGLPLLRSGADASDSTARLAPTRTASAAAAALRERRDAAWQARLCLCSTRQQSALLTTNATARVLTYKQNIMARGTDAAGVGWLLRGFFQDHARQMDGDELAELEAVLHCSSEALASYVEHRTLPPQHLAALPAFRLLCQYHRFWSGAGHEPGGEYV